MNERSSLHFDHMLIRFLIAAGLLSATGACAGSEMQRFAEAGRPDAAILQDAQLADRDAALPRRTVEDRGKPLAGATSSTCMVDDSKGVVCWGSNSRGQLGRGALEPAQDFMAAPVLELSDVVAVEGEQTRFCALTALDEVYCWGHAERYASGVQSESGILTKPTKLENLPAIAEIRVGRVHSCALEKDGGVWCWGSNDAGQIGIAESSLEEPPTRINGVEKTRGIAVGSSVTCALSKDGIVRCWGAAASGIVPTANNSSTPVVIDGLGAVAAIRVGINNACAIEDSGTLKCWGRNQDLQLGAEVTSETVSQPITIDLPEEPVDVQVGRATICALGVSGTLYCWGDGGDGEIGDGETKDRATPIAVSGLSDVRNFGSFYDHNCATNAEGLFCWGSNSRGQLGIAGSEDVLTPQKVPL